MYHNCTGEAFENLGSHQVCVNNGNCQIKCGPNRANLGQLRSVDRAIVSWSWSCSAVVNPLQGEGQLIMLILVLLSRVKIFYTLYHYHLDNLCLSSQKLRNNLYIAQNHFLFTPFHQIKIFVILCFILLYLPVSFQESPVPIRFLAAITMFDP